jgi:hypothetical protein
VESVTGDGCSAGVLTVGKLVLRWIDVQLRSLFLSSLAIRRAVGTINYMELAFTELNGGTGDGWIGSLPGWYRIHVEYVMLYCVSYFYPAIYLVLYRMNSVT